MAISADVILLCYHSRGIYCPSVRYVAMVNWSQHPDGGHLGPLRLQKMLQRKETDVYLNSSNSLIKCQRKCYQVGVLVWIKAMVSQVERHSIPYVHSFQAQMFFCKVSSNRGIHFEKFINKCFSLGYLDRDYSSVPCQAPFVFTAEYVGSFDISKNDDGIKKLHPICVTISTLTMALACVD